MSYSMTIEDIESELDELHPGWDSIVPRDQGFRAKGTPFNTLPYPKLARMKWLLKRRLQLYGGMDDWGVLVAQDQRDPRKCYAHPVPPAPTRPEPPKRIKA